MTFIVSAGCARAVELIVPSSRSKEMNLFIIQDMGANVSANMSMRHRSQDQIRLKLANTCQNVQFAYSFLAFVVPMLFYWFSFAWPDNMLYIRVNAAIGSRIICGGLM